jgi:hypothetical protein
MIDYEIVGRFQLRSQSPQIGGHCGRTQREMAASWESYRLAVTRALGHERTEVCKRRWSAASRSGIPLRVNWNVAASRSLDRDGQDNPWLGRHKNAPLSFGCAV